MNPTISSPTSRFVVPEHLTDRRTPSVSPDRRRYSARYGLDPLLSNLSPTSTLQALEAADASFSSGDDLQDGFAAISESDRTFGIRAALLGTRLNEWHREVSCWPWPQTSLSDRNGFRPPALKNLGSGPGVSDRQGTDHGFALAASIEEHGNIEEEAFCGSIPEKLVQAYEERIETIHHDLDELDVEDLKDFVRDACTNPNSRPHRRRLSGHGRPPSDYNHLDEFTAVVTATIMHALPTISRLNSLLSEWSIRLAILRKVPDFLNLFKETQAGLAMGIHMYQNEVSWENAKNVESVKTSFSTMRAMLEARIFELGRRLDTMLDLLEGKEDTVPEEWIDEMETLESDFIGWVVETERRLMEHFLTIHQTAGEIETRSEELEHVERGSVETTPRGSETMIQDDEMAGQELADNLGTKLLGGDEPSTTEKVAPLTPDRLASRIQGQFSEASRSNPLLNISGAEGLPGNLSIDYDNKKSSAPEVSKSQTSKSESESQRGNTEYERIIMEKECLEPVDNDVHNPVDERAAFPDHPTTDQESKDISHKNNAPSSPRHNFLKTLNVETESLVSGGPKLNPLRSLEPHKEFSVDEPINSFSHNAMHIERPAPKATEVSSIFEYPTPIDDLEVQSPAASVSQLGITPRPSPLILSTTTMNYNEKGSSEISPDTSHPGSGTSDYFSNMSSPEVQHASVAEFFKSPVEVTTPLRSPSTPLASLSRQSSQRTERDGSPEYDDGVKLPPSRPSSNIRRASSFAPDSTGYQITGPDDKKRVRPNHLNSHARVRSASLRSFEKIPRNEVRNIVINRKQSSCPDSRPQSHNGEAPLPAQHASQEPTGPKDLQDDEVYSPTVPTKIKSLPESTDSPPTPPASSEQAMPSQRQPGGSARSQHRFESYSDLTPGSTPAKIRQKKPGGRTGIFSSGKNNGPKDHSGLPPPNSEDQLEARISSILTEFPGQIRLKSGPESDAREILPANISSPRKRPFFRSPGTNSMKTSPGSSSPALTLTPAHSKKSKSHVQDGDPGIKLYHLHQPGADAPIKLFVRLVGEGGERVMVRIGGGWADLAEYLKEYAIHHGRRSISDGRFEIQGLPQSPSAPPSSSVAGYPSSPTSASSRPSSSSGRANHGWPPSPKPKRSSFGSEPADSETAPMTPANPPRPFRPSNSVTPGSIESSNPSYSHRPSSRLSSTTDDDSPSVGLGLAGPKARRTAVSPTKQAWVDGMVDQARKASAEKRPGQRGAGVDTGDFGDLGKVGSTKRVFLKMRRDGIRSGSGSGSGTTAAAASASPSVAGAGAGAGAITGAGAGTFGAEPGPAVVPET